MGSSTRRFNTLNASMFDVVQLGWNPSPASVDADGDGLPDAWETGFGLDPNSSAGDNGASGDPDGDGLTNAQELAGGTHPRGFFKRLFAEGVSNDFFTTPLCGAQPGPRRRTCCSASCGPTARRSARHDHSRPARASRSIRARSPASRRPFSTVVESDVDGRRRSHDELGRGAATAATPRRRSPAPSTTWFLAEGATHGSFDLFYLMQNPGAAEAQVTVRYLRPAPLPPLTRPTRVAANRRFTIWVDGGVSAARRSPRPTSRRPSRRREPIVVERAMYMTNGAARPFGAGHESAGVTAAATSWFLAEGATGEFFDMFVLIANPIHDSRDGAATYLLTDGTTLTKDYTVRRRAASRSGSTTRRSTASAAGQRRGLDHRDVDQRRADRRRARDVVAGRRGGLVRGAQFGGRDDDRHGVGAGRRRSRRHRRRVDLHPGGEHRRRRPRACA